MKIAQYVRLAARESRRSRGRIALFVACIAVGVAAIVLVAGLSTSVNEGIRTEGRRLMAADVSIEGRRPLPPELDTLLSSFARSRNIGDIQRADVREFVSIVLPPGGGSVQLAELKVVDGSYPFYGALGLDPPLPLSELLTADTVVVAPELLERLGIKVGDTLTVGGTAFRIAGAVLEEPDKISISLTLGPRVFLSREGLARTALLDRGARVEYRGLLKMPDGSTPEDASRLKAHLEAGLADAEYFRVRTFTEAQPQLRRSFERIGRYLGLVGLLSLLVGGVGVAQVSRAWLASRMDDIAILRCLGATPREVVILFFAQVVALSLAASIAGAAFGTLILAMLPHFIGGLLPADLVNPWQPAAVGRGVALGMSVAMVFTLPLLIGLRRVPPVRVLRRDAEPVRAGWLAQALAALLTLGGVWAAATTQADSIEHGTTFAGGIVVAVLFLTLAAVGVSRLARLLPRHAGVRLRHGVTHLARPGASTIGAIVALGLGVTFVFATRVVEQNLSRQLRAEIPEDAPTTFMLDVQSDQWAMLAEMLRGLGATGIDSRPIVTARFAAIDGVPVDELTGRRDDPPPPMNAERSDQPDGSRPRPRRWTLTREQRLTYGESLPRGNRVIEGRFPANPETPNGVSIEEGFARDLGVGVGSTISMDVQGVPVDLVVTSLRIVDWRTFGINFFMFVEPGPLNDAPQQRVAVARLPTADLTQAQARIVQAFPNVTLIHIRDVMDKVLAVLENLSLAVRALGMFIIVAGIIVLGGTVAATQAKRSREVALLKAIGMKRADVAAVFAIEYALTGAAAAIVGLCAGGALAWATITRLMDLPWSLSVPETIFAFVLTVALSIAAGLIASARALATRPAEVLRSE